MWRKFYAMVNNYFDSITLTDLMNTDLSNSDAI